MKWYLFAKFFRTMTVEELMLYCKKEGINGPTAMIREGYWTQPDNIKKALPAFVEAAKQYELEVKYADTPLDLKDERFTDYVYDILASHGIECIRLAYIERNNDANPRNLEDIGKKFAEKACKMGKKYSVRSVIQLHGGFYPHNASTAWQLVRDLDPRYVGIKMDPGNNFAQEGYEHFPYQINLLQEYIAALGAKDGCALRVDGDGDGKGWIKPFIPAYAGQTNYTQVFSCLKAVGFNGPAILMPFYNEDNVKLLQTNFTREFSYLKMCAAKAEENRADE